MKIAYCIPGTFNSRGMERVLANKVNYLVEKRGYQVTIITTDQRGRKPFFAMSPEIRHIDLGINYSNPTVSIWNRLGIGQKNRRHRKALTTLLCQERFDIVVSMMEQEFFFLGDIRDGSVKIAEFHFCRANRLPHSGYKKLLKPWYRLRDDRAARKYARLVVLTHEDREWWRELANVVVIPNSIPYMPVTVANHEAKSLLAIGGLTMQKGFDLLIPLWGRLASRYPEWVLHIYGQGPMEAQLRGLMQRLHLDEQVVLHPPTADVEQVYQQSSIFILSSRYEGLPMVLMEAMANGCAVVSYTCPCGPRDLITDGETGLLVDPMDEEAMEAALVRLIENPVLRKQLGEAARDDVGREYSHPQVMEQWVSLFEAVVGEDKQ